MLYFSVTHKYLFLCPFQFVENEYVIATCAKILYGRD